MIKVMLLIFTLALALGLSSCAATSASSQMHDIDVYPIDLVEVENRPDRRITVYAEFRNESNRSVCLHQNQLPEGGFNEAIFRIESEGGEIAPFRPGLPYEWSDKYVFVPSGTQMKLFATIDGQYDLEGLRSFSLMVSLFGYYCSVLEVESPPYISPEGIWTLEQGPRPGVVAFRSMEVMHSRSDRD